ncbi:acetate kinase [Shimazuella sp. AN120528]|uniref:acetate/propionate family kinase n=1 Tax=Shimazuella soli TaxID=1892854 RepID=UPI001F1069E1|nr:acetate kinase [Shimazuella soli]MCH5585527.1 acetate kinase [Shimazuella soli]
MKILVINCGSSSIKYELFEMEDESVIAEGLIEKIGTESAIITYQATDKEELMKTAEILDHREGLNLVLRLLMDDKDGVIASKNEVAAVGHRVVHGGEFFSESAVITSEVRQAIRKTVDLAPLHNPPNLLGIAAAEQQLPDAIHVAVFDTAFHQTMPKHAYLYPLPYVLYTRHKIRRYGFHGTSHKYVSEQAALFIEKPLTELKIISAHIGNGASVTAIDHGISIDTSMGMTPLEGLMMGTRCGDIDPAIVPYVIAKEDLTLSEIQSMMNKHSGLLGVTGMSSDMREVTQAMEEGNEQAKLAIDMYLYKLRKTIGSYIAAMNGVDILLFTAGVGENSSYVRQEVCKELSFFGIELDQSKNNIRSKKTREISTPNSKVKVLVVPTYEELMIAREAKHLVDQQ